MPPRILALECATERCSLALLTGGVLLRRVHEGGKADPRVLLGMVDALLAEAGTTLASLDAIAASVGPGSFTSVRVGVAIAQGLAFGAGLPVVPVMTLESLAFRVIAGGAVAALACLDARMGEVYWAAFSAHAGRGVEALGDPRVEAPDAVRVPSIARLRGIGKGFGVFSSLASRAGIELRPGDSEALPDAQDTAALGALRLSSGAAIDAAQLQPSYVREKVAMTEAERAGG